MRCRYRTSILAATARRGSTARLTRVAALATVAIFASFGCSTSGTSAARRAAGSTTPTTIPASTTTATTLPPPTTTTPAFAGNVAPVSATTLGGAYHDGCPVAPDQLRSVQLSYWGFDDQPHVGTIVVSARVVQDVLAAFSTLFSQRFPIRQMVPVATFGGSDPASMAADNTSGFNCRDAVAPGPPQWSVHAYGEAIDVNPVENPYLEGGTVQPAAGSAFLDRAVARPGMAVADGPLVAAFASVGWQWGGRWTDPDYQHFSKGGG